ncbi:MAG: transglutaminaseTgpA domain-containing protein, partial [Planctomycetota bacterium]
MVLYRVLRVSFYAMVASAVLPPLLAEHNLTYCAWVVFSAAVAYLALDRSRIPPARPVFVYAIALALFVHHFMPVRSAEAWNKEGLAAAAHFLCLFPTFLFFLSYRSAVLLFAGAASLALVILSGIRYPGPWLFLQMVCFVGLSAWTLLLHSLWRAREDFAARGRQAGAGAPSVLTEQALRQGLALTAVLSLSGMALGLFLFFSAPRLNETLAGWIEFLTQRNEPTQSGKSGSGIAGGRGTAAGNSFDSSVDLSGLGPLYANQSPALTADFDSAARGALAPSGRILLRGLALSTYQNGVWRVPPMLPDENLHPPADPSAPGITPSGTIFRQVL